MLQPKQFKYASAACGHPSNRSRKECANCARRRYYKNNKQKILDINERYIKENRRVREAIQRRYREKRGIITPADLKALRRAVKTLEKAMGKAANRRRAGHTDQ